MKTNISQHERLQFISQRLNCNAALLINAIDHATALIIKDKDYNDEFKLEFIEQLNNIRQPLFLEFHFFTQEKIEELEKGLKQVKKDIAKSKKVVNE